MKKYFDIFESVESVHGWAPPDLKDEEVLIAVYSYEDYSGSAFVVYQRNGKLYEVHESHCSCNELETWEPEETTWAALSMRDYSDYGHEFEEAYKALVALHIQ